MRTLIFSLLLLVLLCDIFAVGDEIDRTFNLFKKKKEKIKDKDKDCAPSYDRSFTDDVDRTFNLFKKKKEKIKDKLKPPCKPSYKPPKGIKRTFFKKKHKNKNKDKKKPSYKPSYRPPAVPHQSYSPVSYHGMTIKYLILSYLITV